MKTRKNKFPHMMNMEEMQAYRNKCSNHDGANFLQVEHRAIKKYGSKKANLLTMYISKAKAQTLFTPENGGWFYFLTSDIQEMFPDVTEEWLATFRKEMKELGILRTIRIGLNPIVWNFIDMDRHLELLEKDAQKSNLENSKKPPSVSSKKEEKSHPSSVNAVTPEFPGHVTPMAGGLIKHKINTYNHILSANALCGTPGVPPNLLSNDPLDIISYWNTLPNVTKHKLDPSSKTIQSACKMLSALLQGIPMVNTKGNQPRKEMRTFFQSYKIDQVYLRKKWSVQEIKNHLLSAVTIKNGQMNTKISLPVLLWNEFASKDSNGNKTAFSWFFYALAIDCTPQAFIDMATSLAKSVNGKNHPILKWANELYRFSLAEEMTPPPMAALLRWYLLNKDQSFMPMVRDMDEFIRKYRQIEDNRSHRRKNGGRSRLHVDEPVEFYDCKGNLIPSEQSGKINVDELEFYDGKGNLIPKDSAR